MNERLRRHVRTYGLTVVELLVAMAVLAVVLGGIYTFLQGTLRYTNLTTAISVSIEDIADAEGYLSDTFREAKLVIGDFQFVDESGASSKVIVCQVANNDCVGLLAPVVDTTVPRQPIINFDLVVFRVQESGTTFEGVGIPPGWDGEETPILVEYRNRNVCPTTCSTATEVVLAGSTYQVSEPPGFILGNLVGENASGTPVQFFVLDESDTNFLLHFVVRADSATSNPYVIRETPVALQVAVRR